jgi:hypothetical protein
VLLLLIPRQPEITQLWARRSKGFDVIPMAKQVQML